MHRSGYITYFNGHLHSDGSSMDHFRCQLNRTMQLATQLARGYNPQPTLGILTASNGELRCMGMVHALCCCSLGSRQGQPGTRVV